jgi:hypothetical protein
MTIDCPACHNELFDKDLIEVVREFVRKVRQRAQKTEGDGWYATATAFNQIAKESLDEDESQSLQA